MDEIGGNAAIGGGGGRISVIEVDHPDLRHTVIRTERNLRGHVANRARDGRDRHVPRYASTQARALSALHGVRAW